MTRCFLAGLGGVLLATAPVIIYFVSNNALGSLIECYSSTNLHSYNNVDSGLFPAFVSISRNLANGIWISLRYNLANCIFMVCGLFWFHKRKERLLYLILCGVTFLFVCAAISPQKYYPFLFAAFSAPGILFICNYCERAINSRKCRSIASLVICALLIVSLSPNLYMLMWTKDDLPQYRFASVINQSQNKSLLNYGFLDCGYYTTADIVPDCRYFCKLNMELPEAKEAQDYYVAHGITEFVVSRDKPINSNKYVLRDSFTYYFENGYRTDYLFQRKK